MWKKVKLNLQSHLQISKFIHQLNLQTIFIPGTHGELIKNPEGAYSQLVRLQEGAKESKDSQAMEADLLETSLDIDKPISRSSSQRQSIRRSISRGSSGSQHSFTLTSFAFGVPGPINIHENEETEQNIETKEKPQEVSLVQLARLNKPELPVLLLGAVAAVVHGMVFPVFGLLLSKAIRMFYEPPQELRKDSKYWAVVYVLMGCITLVALPAQNSLFGIAGGKLIERIRSMTFEKVVHQEISWFDDSANSRCV